MKTKDCKLAGIQTLISVMSSQHISDAILCLKDLDDECLDHLINYSFQFKLAINSEINMRKNEDNAE